jgi:hypothetical protein
MPRIISLAYCEACQVVEKWDERRTRSTITASIPARRGHSAFHHTTSLTRPGGLHRTGMEHGEGGRFSSVAQAALLGAQRTPGRKTTMRKPHCICCSPFLSLARGAHFSPQLPLYVSWVRVQSGPRISLRSVGMGVEKSWFIRAGRDPSVE